jgi:hypothetical protein
MLSSIAAQGYDQDPALMKGSHKFPEAESEEWKQMIPKFRARAYEKIG